jgi:hypothetical protein
VPAKEHLEQWIAVARMLTPEEEAEAMSVDEIPEAVTEPVAQRTQAWVPPSQRAAQVISGGSTASPHETLRAPETADNTWRKVDPSKFATIEDYNEGRIAVKPLSRDRMDTSAREADSDVEAAPSRRPQRIRSKGEPLSRWVRRGVVHSRPLHTWIGALVSVASRPSSI